mmetsp:Transcript_5585/g.8206  ORF Transcript_5585/g.8206 Transcript_5585/m.8206 type:complete len:279 (-) Transcript_5585:274-1110(-)
MDYLYVNCINANNGQPMSIMTIRRSDIQAQAQAQAQGQQYSYPPTNNTAASLCNSLSLRATPHLVQELIKHNPGLFHVTHHHQDNNQTYHNTGYWTDHENVLFEEGLAKYGRSWVKVAEHIGTRNPNQVRSHAQKYFKRLESGDNNPKTGAAAPENVKKVSPKKVHMERGVDIPCKREVQEIQDDDAVKESGDDEFTSDVLNKAADDLKNLPASSAEFPLIEPKICDDMIMPHDMIAGMSEAVEVEVDALFFLKGSGKIQEPAKSSDISGDTSNSAEL